MPRTEPNIRADQWDSGAVFLQQLVEGHEVVREGGRCDDGLAGAGLVAILVLCDSVRGLRREQGLGVGEVAGAMAAARGSAPD